MFLKENYRSTKERYPNLTSKDMQKKLAELWKALPREEREVI